MDDQKNMHELPRGGKLGRMAKVLLDQAGVGITEKVMQGHEDFTRASLPREKAVWIRRMIRRLEDNCGSEICQGVMETCGRKCCGISTRTQASKIWEGSDSLEDFLRKMNQRGLGGGRLVLKDANTISGGYDKCYCGQVSQTDAPFPTLTYCQCSAGWYKQLFEAALGLHVEVRLVQSIISGAPSCEFEISIPSAWNSQVL